MLLHLGLFLGGLIASARILTRVCVRIAFSDWRVPGQLRCAVVACADGGWKKLLATRMQTKRSQL